MGLKQVAMSQPKKKAQEYGQTYLNLPTGTEKILLQDLINGHGSEKC